MGNRPHLKLYDMAKKNYNDELDYAEQMDIQLSGSDEWISGELFDGMRLEPDSIPTGKHLYWMRHDEGDMGTPVSISPSPILVDFYGSFVTDEELPISEEAPIIDYGF